MGMTPLALIGKQLGKEVRGADLAEEYLTDEVLNQAGISWQVGFEAGDLPKDCDYLVATAAHGGMTNPLVAEAKRRKITALSYGEALAELANRYQVVAVTGVGGKTTTTAMLATGLKAAGLDPSFVIGAASSPPHGLPGYLGKGKYFVVEADDYVTCPLTNLTPKFLFLKPKVVVMTNLEYDHPDVYPNLKAMVRAYQRLAASLPKDGLLVVNHQSRNLQKVIATPLACSVKSFGFNQGADFTINNFCSHHGGVRFNLANLKVELAVPGRFNAMNAAAALVVTDYLGANAQKVLEVLKQFKGVKRRFELVGYYRGVPIYDDYAHQPNEIKATLQATREWFPQKRLRVVFQPHTYSRTKALLHEFATSLNFADEVILLEIFASQREKDNLGVSSLVLAKAIGKKASYFPDRQKAESYLREDPKRGDLILTMGAGDVYHLAESLTDEGDETSS